MMTLGFLLLIVILVLVAVYVIRNMALDVWTRNIILGVILIAILFLLLNATGILDLRVGVN